MCVCVRIWFLMKPINYANRIMYSYMCIVCIYIYIHTYVYIYIYVYIYPVRIHMHIHTFTCECIYIYTYVYNFSDNYVIIYAYRIIEGSLEVKLPTICRDGKAEVGRVSEEKSRSEKIRDEESQKKEDAGARKGKEVAIHYVFRMICGSGGSKSNLAKAAGAEPAGQRRDEKAHSIVARSTFRSPKNTNVGPLLEVELSKKCTPLWREAHFQVKMYKNPQSQTTLGSWDVEKVHAALSGSWDVEKCTPLWREAHFQVKMVKHHMFGPLFDVQMSKKCTSLWRETRFQVKSVKNWGVVHLFWR